MLCADISEHSFCSINNLTPVILPAYATYEDGTNSVLKRWHIKFRCWGITQKKEYNIQVFPSGLALSL